MLLPINLVYNLNHGTASAKAARTYMTMLTIQVRPFVTLSLPPLTRKSRPFEGAGCGRTSQ